MCRSAARWRLHSGSHVRSPGVLASSARTFGANSSKIEPDGGRSYLGERPASNARSTVPRETPISRAISRFECLPDENKWRISAQSSNLITFHNGRWSCFQLANSALFSVGVNRRLFERTFLLVSRAAERISRFRLAPQYAFRLGNTRLPVVQPSAHGEFQ